MQNGPVQSGSQFLPVDIAKDVEEKDLDQKQKSKNDETNRVEDEKPFDLDKVDDLEKSKQDNMKSND